MSCINPCCCKDSLLQSRVQKPPPPTTSGVVPIRKKGHGVATKLINGVSAAFFSSLELCYCVYIGTKDDSDDPESLPLVRVDGGFLQKMTEDRVNAGMEKKMDGTAANNEIEIK
ncbi:hypothetical protein U1Q18_011993 [Sarracenia purpurea var. burkii]